MTTQQRKAVIRAIVQTVVALAATCLVALVCSVGGAWEQVGR